MVVGEPGAGKSALSAQLICSRSSNPYIHERIIGYHLCKYSDKATQDPGRFVRNLVDLIARRVPEYGMLVHNSSFIPRILQRSCLRDPYDCFEQVIAIPLRQLNNERRHYFIIIDALDECSHDTVGTPMVQFIQHNLQKFPNWIRLVMTTRNDSTVLKHFSNIPKLHLSSADPRNMQDVEIFIATKLFEDTPFLERLKGALGFRSREEVSYLTNKILSRSQGNFHFAKEMLYFWKEDWQKDDLNQLPKTIGEQYESYLRRAYGSREKFKPALAILEVLVAAFEPIKINRVFDVVRIREKIDYEYDFVYTLKGLSHFITYGEDNSITLFHLSFIEWLTSRENVGNPYYVSRSRGHSRLAEYYLSDVEKTQNSTMDIYRLAQHISFDENGDYYLQAFRNISSSSINRTIDKNNGTLLHLAARNSNKKILKLISPSFENIDCEDSYGFTPAFVATIDGRLENLKFLILKGANIERRTKPPPPVSCLLSDPVLLNDPVERSKTSLWNSTMMHAAAASGHLEVVQFLLERNSSAIEINGVNMTALELAAQSGHSKIVQLLYESGAHVSHESLQHASAGGHVDVVKFLLNAGAKDKCMRCDGSFYWLQEKIRYQAMPLCNSTIVHDYILSDDRFKILCQSALHLAVAGNHFEVVKRLLNLNDETTHCTDFTGRTPLHEAARQNNVEIAKLLIQKGAKVSRKCSVFQNLSSLPKWFRKKSCERDGLYHRKHSPLTLLDEEEYDILLKKLGTFAIYNRKYPLLSSVEELEYDKDLCHCGTSPFLLTARYGHVEVASLLLHYNARPNDLDCQGATAIHVAACHGHYNYIRWLILQRPSLHITLRSKNQSTPLHSGAICKANNDIKPLIDMGASVQTVDQKGMTPLHYAVLNPFKMDVVELHLRNITNDKYLRTFFLWSSDGNFTFWEGDSLALNIVFLMSQCRKMIQLSSVEGTLLINKADESGRTPLHLAAQNGEVCPVLYLLKMGARTDVTDINDNTPLDNAIAFAVDGESSFPGEENGIVLALHKIHHNPVIHILLSQETLGLTPKCGQKRTSLLHRAFERGQAFTAYTILSMGGGIECKDSQGRTPLLIYLQNGGKWLDVVLMRFNVTVHIECGKPFNISEFHLLAFRRPTDPSQNVLEKHLDDGKFCFSNDGPLVKAIKAHPLGFQVIDKCRDAEGYTALHRAAQGGNVVVLKKFLSWGANPTLLTPQGYSALDLAIIAGINPFPWFETRHAVEEAAELLLRSTRSISRFDVGCDCGEAKLTIYHLSAYAGLSGFVTKMLMDTSLIGLDVNCPNLHGITPLYLAKLYVGTFLSFDPRTDPWQEVVEVIEEYGGVLSFPSREVELNVLYKHLFGRHLDPFRLDTLKIDSEKFDRSAFSHCREDEWNYYKNGPFTNLYAEAVFAELSRIISESASIAAMNFQLVPAGDQNKKQNTKTLRDRAKAHREIWNLLEEVLKSLKTEFSPKNVSVNISSNHTIKVPKILEEFILQDLLRDKKVLNGLEQTLSVFTLFGKSRERISYMYKRLEYILNKYSSFFGDTTILLKLLRKYEGSAICLDEIVHAQFLTFKFVIYVLKCRTDDFVSLYGNILERANFISTRIPKEWKTPARYGWTRAIKFIYRQATQRDLTFDYLQVLSLGCDKNTRIPLSIDTFYSP